MKRFIVLACSLAFFLFALIAGADLTFSDIARWGLMRRPEVFPGGGAMLYETGGVLRVVERVRVVDTNRLTMTVYTNLPTSNPVFGELSNGVYHSLSWIAGAAGQADAIFDWNGVSVSFSMREQASDAGCHQIMFGPDEVYGWGSTNAWDRFPAELFGVVPEGSEPVGYAVIDYWRGEVVVTNEFVSAERLQDAVDDLRQEISEAIEAHVQLLHP